MNEEVNIEENQSSAMTAMSQDQKDSIIAELKDKINLKKSRYIDKKNSYKNVYILQNVKTGKIVELNASSAFQACKFVGWKPNKVKILSES